ncbi:60S acidic ribosomal protein P1 [Sciurus carolinensis]|uniref:60S acidic ribosomal protein P1 n=1 Tax=Sciurus carolinensis TaxID=30640 RepID=A0AA41MRC2_SCICA|nr:60S acidic ribosomal protein P1 [Sciurus carolinensis]
MASLVCIYPNFILYRGRDKNNVIIKTAGVNFGPFWPGWFAKALTIVNIRSLICNVGTGGPAPAGGPVPTTAAPGEEKKEEAKKEESEDSDDDMGFGLFN